MSTRHAGNLPSLLEGVRRRFERWRAIRTGRTRIPDTLWASAALVAETFGISRTAQVLRVNPRRLKNRVVQQWTTTNVSSLATVIFHSHPVANTPPDSDSAAVRPCFTALYDQPTVYDAHHTANATQPIRDTLSYTGHFSGRRVPLGSARAAVV